MRDTGNAPPRSIIAMLVHANHMQFDTRVQKQVGSAVRLGYEPYVLAYTARDAPRPPWARDGVKYVQVKDPYPRVSRTLARLEQWRSERTAAAIRAYSASRTGRGPTAKVVYVFQGCRLAFQHAVGAPLQLLREQHLVLVARSFNARAAFRPQLEQLDPIIVHANDLDTLEAAYAYCRRSGAALVYDSHEFHLDPRPGGTRASRLISQALEGRVRHAQAVLTVSEPIASELERTHGISRPRVVLNAPRLEWLDAPPAVDLREVCGAADGDRLIVYVGGIHPARGTTQLVRAIARLPAEFRLVLLSTSRSRVAEHLRDVARELGIADRIHVVPPVPAEQVSATIAVADVSAIPFTDACRSQQLTMTNKLFESLLAGVPIVVSRQAQEMARFVVAEQLGAVFDVTSLSSIAHAIELVTSEIPPGIADRTRLWALQNQCAWEAQETVLGEAYARAAASAVT